MRLERANSKRPVTWLSLFGLVLIPIIVAAGFIMATWNSTDRLDTIEAAIVNNDDGAEVDGETVPIGRQLTSGLVGEEDNNIHWVITDEEDAENGMSDGSYAATLTIPEGFSRAVTSVSDAKSATQTQLDVDVSGVAPAADTQIAQSVAGVARTTFNTKMTETYLDNIYVGFNEIGDQMKDLGDAAGELDNGAEGLAEGTKKSASGAGELSDGMEKLDASGAELNKGAGDLSQGAGELSKGTSELSGGLQELKKSTADLPDSTQKLADGAGELSGGVDEYTKSIDQIIKGFADSGDSGSGEGGIDELVKGGKDLDKGAQGVSEGAEGLSSGLGQYRDGLQKGADQADQLAKSGTVTGLDDLVSARLMSKDQAEQARAGLCQPGTPDAVCQGMEQAYAQGLLNGTSGGLNSAVDGLEQKQDGQSLLGGADKLADGAGELSDGMSKFVKGLEDGLGELTKGMEDISKNAPKLLEASKGLREGASGVAEGNQKLADGMPELSDGIAQVADGSSELDDGAGQLSDGLGDFATGLDKYTTGVSTAATGTSDLAAGLDTLAEGTDKYSEGVGKFADGVKKGADQVPSYSAPERDKLSTVASANIKAPSSDSPSDVLQGSTLALLIMLALWVGGLVTYTVLKPIPASTLLSTKSSVAVWLRGLVPGVIVGLLQALVLSILAVSVLDIGAVQGFDIAVLTFVSALVFMVLNFALVAWFGGVGRFLSVIAVVLAVAGRTIGAVPQFFDFLAPILPLTPAMNGFSAITAGTTGVGAAYGGLLAWAIIGVVMSLLAIVRARTTKPEAALQMADA
ncbi:MULTISPECIES: YhgE/Pip domain-containing protein [Brevibacterium]|uniref:YhgE/Pip N-terminal domain-containing protein n=2 Tax=Brevibacterium antiquum TaxID=234835 RepID=A0A2H1KRD0_9MICO|nr:MULTISPECIES: YhgE/Pip domain-containing protein [Brevibacterium]SMX87362.1 YhgE/Pip N-terminal domain-containing protein [Brevibacterium antiquum]SMY01792.1 YhgE/Pip N-terminal domain-containing protein [Brevibacterium antiquum CNRZ 918]HCG56104.1 YhgE/Pip domain-containing protein [Brevibacterium sp.]